MEGRFHCFLSLVLSLVFPLLALSYRKEGREGRGGRESQGRKGNKGVLGGSSLPLSRWWWPVGRSQLREQLHKEGERREMKGKEKEQEKKEIEKGNERAS